MVKIRGTYENSQAYTPPSLVISKWKLVRRGLKYNSVMYDFVQENAFPLPSNRYSYGPRMGERRGRIESKINGPKNAHYLLLAVEGWSSLP